MASKALVVWPKVVFIACRIIAVESNDKQKAGPDVCPPNPTTNVHYSARPAGRRFFPSRFVSLSPMSSRAVSA